MDAQLLLAPRGFFFHMHFMKTKVQQFLMLFSAISMMVVGHPDTAQAQNSIAFSPNPVQFTASLTNAGIQSKDVSVTVNGQPATSVSGSGTVGYLSAAPSATPGALTVIANSSGLQPGTYNGSINVTANGLSAALPVMLTVYGSNTITLSTNTLTFNAQANGSGPASQTVNVTGSVPGIPFSVTQTTATGGNWLSVAQTGTVVPASVVVSANPGSLAAGTYTGTVTVTSDQIAPQTIAVTLVVSGQPVLVVTPNPITLLYQTGVGAAAPSVTAQVQTTGTSLSYTGSVNYTSCPGFFTVTSGLSGATNASLVVSANLTAIGTNQQCAGNIVLNATGAANSTVTVPVTFQASAQPLLSASPTVEYFSYSIGSALPAAQPIAISSSGNTALNYSVSSSVPWLMIPATPPNGFNTPNTLMLALNPTGLAQLNPGTYQGTVTITAFGSGNSPLNIVVNLTVSNNALLTVSPNFANFNYQVGGTVPSLTVNLASTMGSLPYTISVPITTGAQFVNVSPISGTATTTSTPLTLTLIPSVVVGLAPGTYQNQIQIAAGNITQFVQVNLTVSTAPLVNVTPQQLSFNYALNGALPQQQTLNVSSTNGSSLPVSFSSNQTFLLVAGSTNTPNSVNVAVQPAGLTPGIYNAQITVTSGTQVQTVPVTLTVTSGITLTATPATLSFTQAANGTAPAAQTVTVATTGNTALGYSASVTGSFLSITGNAGGVFQGNAPGSFTVTANGGQLAPGTYTGSVVITAVGAANPSVTIPVTLTITAQTLAAAPASLTFNAAVQGASPATRTINVTSAIGSAVPFTATAQSSGGNWLSVTPATGTTPQNVTVSVNQTGLAAGSYTGTVTLTSTAQGSTPLTVPVMLTVGAQAAPLLSQVSNAGSFANGPVAPGEIVSLFGTNLGPVTPATLTLTPQGNVSTNLSNVQVLFDGIAAPLTYVSATQINAVVPYEVFGRATTNVVVNFNGVNAAALQLNVAAAAPGIFILTGTQAAVLNQNSSINSTTNPAAKGSTVVIYATGEGQTNPAGVTGSVAGTTLKNPQGTVSVTVGGQPATVAYAGSAPGLVSGVLQLNVVVPAGAPSGANVPVVVTVGGVSSQQNATVAVQ